MTLCRFKRGDNAGIVTNGSSTRNQLCSLACTNTIENICRVIPNLKQWLNAAMALRWTGRPCWKPRKGFCRLKAHRQLPILKADAAVHAARHTGRSLLDREATAA
jgi:hypothetical protein